MTPQRQHFHFGFEKLEVWQKAIEFAGLIYGITGKFPDAERFGLVSQMRRAAVSIPSNIAEGSARGSRTDFARFLEIATGSLYEVVTQAVLARNQLFVSEADYSGVRERAQELTRMLSGLRNSLQNSPK